MATIPQISRDRLASSLVGTPGFNSSGQNIGQSVAKFGSQVADVAFQALSERKQILDQTEALKQASDYEIETYKVFEEHQKQYADDPTDKTQVLQDQLKQNLDTRLSNISSPAVKQAVTRAGYEVMGNTTLKQMAWAHDQEAVKAFNNVTQTINNRAEELNYAGQSGDLGKLDEIMRSMPVIMSSSKGILSAEQQAKLRDLAPKSWANAFILGAMDTNPALAYNLIKKGTFDNYVTEEGDTVSLLSPEEKQRYVDMASHRVAKVSETAQMNHLTGIMAGHNELMDKYLNSPDGLTAADVNAIRDPKSRAVFQELYSQAHPMSVQQKYDTYGELWSNFYNLKVDSKKQTAKASLEKLADFQRSVIKARANNIITDEQAETFFKATTPPLNKKADDAFKRQQNSFQEGYQVIDSWLKSAGRDKDVTVKGELMNKFASAYMRDLRTNNVRPVRDVAQLAIREFATQEHPSLGLLPGTPNSIMRGDGTQIKLLPGQTQIRTDKSAPTDGSTLKMDPITKTKVRVYPDGRMEVVK